MKGKHQNMWLCVNEMTFSFDHIANIPPCVLNEYESTNNNGIRLGLKY